MPQRSTGLSLGTVGGVGCISQCNVCVCVFQVSMMMATLKVITLGLCTLFKLEAIARQSIDSDQQLSLPFCNLRWK